MIPPREDGVLPEGDHDCTVADVDRIFGRFQRSDRRIRLMTYLKAYLEDAQQSGLAVAVVVDGSFVTAKDEPDDIDLLIVLKPDIPWDSLRPFEYNLISKRMIRQIFHLDALARVAGDARYEEALEFVMRVNPDKHAGLTSRVRKGVLRVWL